MKIVSTLVILFTVAGLALLGSARAENPEEAAIRQAIDHYFQGHATGQGDHFRKVFHPESKLFWIRDGKFNTRTSEEYIARAPGKPAEDEARRKRRIANIDITGNAAMVKIVLDYPTATLTDYMAMLKIDGEWKIVNKIFFSAEKAR